MSQKLPRNQRRKLAEAARAESNTPATTPEVVRRRRNRRLLFLGILAVALPGLEVLAYRFRSITIRIVNNSNETVTNVKFTYPGGGFEVKELQPQAEFSQQARPNFSFTSSHFSTYSTRVAAFAPSGAFSLNELRTGTVDYSARETYTIEANETARSLKFRHTTYPGFPLGAVRDLLTRLGVR